MLKSILLSLLISLPAMAEEEVRVSCVTEFPTTTYQILEDEEQFHLVVLHHNGTKYLPLFSGTITPNDIPMLQERAEQMQKMGTYNKIPFKKEECKNKGLYWRCAAERKIQLGELEVDRVIFWMSKMEVKYDDEFEWSSTETLLSLKMGSKHLDMRYSYFGNDCRALN